MKTENKHPLFDKKIRTINSWPMWKEAWDTTEEFTFLHSLLHFGFEVDIRDRHDLHEERILFYLQIAEGHAVSVSLDEQAGLKRRLARKAFEVLCLNYFKQVMSQNITCSLSKSSLDELKIHEAVLHFFRPEADLDSSGRLKLKNLPDLLGHHASIASNFLSELIRLCWDYKIGWLEPPLVDHAPLRKYRWRYIEILMGLERLDMLLLRRAPDIDLLMDDASMAKLKELALKLHISPSGSVCMYPTSVKHAANIGSKAAQAYLVLQAMREVEDRNNID